MTPIIEPYRVILDYEALQDGFADRIDDLNTTLEQIEINGEFAKGVAQKLLTKSSGRLRRSFGWESLGKMLKGTGLALVLVVDDERFAPLKEQLCQRKRPRLPTNVGQVRPKWLFTPRKASKMRAKWWDSLTDLQRKRHQRKAQKGTVAARRRRRKERERVSA